MKFKNQVSKLEKTSDECLTQVETSKIKRDHEEIKTLKKIIKKGISGFVLTCDQASLKKREEGPTDRRLAWF